MHGFDPNVLINVYIYKFCDQWHNKLGGGLPNSTYMFMFKDYKNNQFQKK